MIAGRQWGDPWEEIRVPPGREGSWEDVLHRDDPTDKLLLAAGWRWPPKWPTSRAPLDVFVVRKLGVPGREELATGAAASGWVRVVNPLVVQHPAEPRPSWTG